jgi:hypothetical protein
VGGARRHRGVSGRALAPAPAPREAVGAAGVVGRGFSGVPRVSHASPLAPGERPAVPAVLARHAARVRAGHAGLNISQATHRRVAGPRVPCGHLRSAGVPAGQGRLQKGAGARDRVLRGGSWNNNNENNNRCAYRNNNNPDNWNNNIGFRCVSVSPGLPCSLSTSEARALRCAGAYIGGVPALRPPAHGRSVGE